MIIRNVNESSIYLILDYNEIPQIKELSDSVSEIHKQLAAQITEEFKNTFNISSSNNAKMSLSKLKDACLIISVLDGKVKRDILKWFISEWIHSSFKESQVNLIFIFRCSTSRIHSALS